MSKFRRNPIAVLPGRGGGRIEYRAMMTDGKTKAGAPRNGVVARLRAFLDDRDGASTVDWVVVAAGATGLGLLLLAMGQESLGGYSSDVRSELQSSEFQTDWVHDLPVNMN